MVNALFTAFESVINEIGTKGEESVDLSELSIIGAGDEKVISFSFLGSNFLFTPSGDVVAIDGTDGDSELYALAEPMRKGVEGFISWRLEFAREFRI
jgi:hypothetical protein